MNIEEIRDYCIAKPGVTEGFPFDESEIKNLLLHIFAKRRFFNTSNGENHLESSITFCINTPGFIFNYLRT